MIRLKQYLEESGISQAELARRVGVKQPTVWEWVNGASKPSANKLLLLSEETGMSINELLEDVAA